jgi:hypothetical protein
MILRPRKAIILVDAYELGIIVNLFWNATKTRARHLNMGLNFECESLLCFALKCELQFFSSKSCDLFNLN